ncbi:hypothetical protein [Anatilimnocola floriformis]|uniref:hypothetical protein n=1 Tax=Anatilimnocola floriformis TaxID=2948575 RepID=UPI0020C2B6F1|nr:hypothetical protein [Anatilimnocola floriformis]
MKRFRGRSAWLLAGLALGLLAGVGSAAAIMFATRPAASSQFSWPQGVPLSASTATSSETMAIATGRVDDQVEGLVTLDFITGDLQTFVMNPRTGKLVGWFKTNVTTQLPVDKSKKPAYLLSTGSWEPVGFSSQQRPAGCVVYVADANTGMFYAYTFPWIKGAASTGITQSTPMLPLDGGKARNITLRAE